MRSYRPAMRADRLASPAKGLEIFAGFVLILKVRGAEHGYALPADWRRSFSAATKSRRSASIAR
jgi:hypothetical protein